MPFSPAGSSPALAESTQLCAQPPCLHSPHFLAFLAGHKNRSCTASSHVLLLELSQLLLHGLLVDSSSGLKLRVMHQPPLLLLAEEVEDRLASASLGEAVRQLRQPIHPSQLGPGFQSRVHRNGELVATAGVAKPMQRGKVPRHGIKDAAAIHHQSASNLPHGHRQVAPVDWLTIQLSHHESDHVVLVLSRRDGLDFSAIGPENLSRGPTGLPLHQGELDFFALQGRRRSDAREDTEGA